VDGIDVNACRAVTAREGDTAVTRVPGVLVARFLGNSSEAARQYFVALWACVRPVVAGREAVAPRIWST
jgi:urease accessory protein